MLSQIKEVSCSLLSVIRSPDIMALRFILVATAALKSKKAKDEKPSEEGGAKAEKPKKKKKKATPA